MNICHFTSLHYRYDTRVFVKQCCSLVKMGHKVTLIVSDGRGDEVKNGVSIINIGKSSGTKNRIFQTNKLILKKAIEIDADFYFYHDPELSIQAISLTKVGKKVIYDAHEDSPRQYISNASSGALKTKIISKIIEFVEDRAAKNIFGMMTATEGIKERYDKFNSNVIVVKNYPIIDELKNDKKWEDRNHQACYVGGLRDTRGILEIIRAWHERKIPLKLAGPWQPSSFEKIAKSEQGWINTEYLGFLNRQEIAKLLSESKIGFLTLYKTPNHIHSLPIKMYEYMAAGVPVIASDITLWEEIVQNSNSGLCVEPKNVAAISKAINHILYDSKTAYNMGQNGFSSVIKKHSWDSQIKKLRKLHNQLI